MSDDPSPTGAAAKRLQDFWSWFDGTDPAPAEAKNEDRYQPQRDWEVIDKKKTLGFAITGSGRRKRPDGIYRRRILARQKDKCLYCEQTFGTKVIRRGKGVYLQLHWDHFVPYAYGRTNESRNWVAACHVCNGIKGCRMFDTVGEAQRFIINRWIEKGYEIPSLWGPPEEDDDG